MKHFCILWFHALQFVFVSGSPSQIHGYAQEDLLYNDNADFYQNYFDDSDKIIKEEEKVKDPANVNTQNYVDYSNVRADNVQPIAPDYGVPDAGFQQPRNRYRPMKRPKPGRPYQKGFYMPRQGMPGPGPGMPFRPQKLRRKDLNWEAMIKDFYSKIQQGNDTMIANIDNLMDGKESGDKALDTLTDQGYGGVVPAVFTGLGAGLIRPTYVEDTEAKQHASVRKQQQPLLDKASLPEFYLLFGETAAGAGKGAAEGAGTGAGLEAGKAAGLGSGMGVAQGVAMFPKRNRGMMGQGPTFVPMMNYGRFMQRRKNKGDVEMAYTS